MESDKNKQNDRMEFGKAWAEMVMGDVGWVLLPVLVFWLFSKNLFPYNLLPSNLIPHAFWLSFAALFIHLISILRMVETTVFRITGFLISLCCLIIFPYFYDQGLGILVSIGLFISFLIFAVILHFIRELRQRENEVLLNQQLKNELLRKHSKPDDIE